MPTACGRRPIRSPRILNVFRRIRSYSGIRSAPDLQYLQFAMSVSNGHIEVEAGTPPALGVNSTSLRVLLLGVSVLLVLYLCWRIVMPFLPALCWAFAVALIGDPIYAWLIRRRLPRNLAALSIILTAIVVIGPAVLLVGALAREASEVVNQLASEAGAKNLREAIESNSLLGPIFRWLDSRYDLLAEVMQLARSAAGWASSTVLSVLTGSIWFLSQVATTMFVLFYFLRDGEKILKTLRSVVPLSIRETDVLFTRIAQMIRVSLGGKLVVAAIQRTLGGLMFAWLGLPAPIFWGCVMALLSVFPVIGAFVGSKCGVAVDCASRHRREIRRVSDAAGERERY
jgi:predicted PurR-regulated permease PerM